MVLYRSLRALALWSPAPVMTASVRASYVLPFLLAGFLQTNAKPEKIKDDADFGTLATCYPCPHCKPFQMDCNKDVKGTIYKYEAVPLGGNMRIQFQQYAGKLVLFVNVATYCGLTAQYLELNTLQEELKPLGLVVLGFPCNQFGNQEPGDNMEILPGLKHVRPGGGYVPNFQLFEKGNVNGENEQKIFTFLKSSCPHPSEILSSFRHISWEPVKVQDIRWNFEKFLVGPDGIPVMRWFHKTPVSTTRMDILAYLKQFKVKQEG